MGFETLPHNDYLATLEHLANVGPISTSVAAADWGMYFGGVFDGCDYDESISVNHAVQLVLANITRLTFHRLMSYFSNSISLFLGWLRHRPDPR